MATADDAREQNDSVDQVVQAPLSTETNPTANLGLLNELTMISELSLLDQADWFRFETSKVGRSVDFVRVDFDSTRGDLDLSLYRRDGTVLTLIASDSRSQGDFAQVSLLGLPAGEYLIEIKDDGGERNPAYLLRIAPPGAATDQVNLGLGIVDLVDTSFVAQFDTNGSFLADVAGLLRGVTGNSLGVGPVEVEFEATADNDGLDLTAAVDLGDDVTIGDDLLLIDNLVTAINVTIDFDTGAVSGGLAIEAQKRNPVPRFRICRQHPGRGRQSTDSGRRRNTRCRRQYRFHQRCDRLGSSPVRYCARWFS